MADDIGPQGLLDMVESETMRLIGIADELRPDADLDALLKVESWPFKRYTMMEDGSLKLEAGPIPCNVDTGATPVAQRGKLLKHGAQYEIHNQSGQPLMYWDGAHAHSQRWAFDGFSDKFLPLTPATGPMPKVVMEDNGWTPVRVMTVTASGGVGAAAFDPPPQASSAPPVAKDPVEVAQELFDELPASEPEKPQSVVEAFDEIRQRMEEIRREEGRQAPA